MEERSVEEELDGALVHPQAELFGLLCQRRPQRTQGLHHTGRQLLRRGVCVCLVPNGRLNPEVIYQLTKVHIYSALLVKGACDKEQRQRVWET